MNCNDSNRGSAAPARAFMVLCAALAMGLGLMAKPAEAAPFAYVANDASSTVSVIDTTTIPPSVTATVAVGSEPEGVAVTPDGKHVYVANLVSNSVSVIDTATNTVEAATVPVGNEPVGVAITPDGAHVYVTNEADNTVSVIDTATNTVEAATLEVGNAPDAVAVAPDGKHAFVVNFGSGNVSVIDTTTTPPSVTTTLAVGINPDAVAVTPDGTHAYVVNETSNNISVIDTATTPPSVQAAMILVGNEPFGVAVTPDGTHAYVTNEFDNTVSVIDTATNTVEVATLAVGTSPVGVAVTPDGKHAYVANIVSNNVSVIDTASNTVVATVPVGNTPVAVGIIPPPPGVPFLAFSATQLGIAFGTAPNTDSFNLQSLVTLSSTANKGINPVTQAVTLQVGTFTTTIPAGSFTKQPDGSFTFTGVIGGVSLNVVIKQQVTLRYFFNVTATGVSLTGTKNSVYVTLIIGPDSGASSVTAANQGQASPL